MKKEETTSVHFGILGIFSLILAMAGLFLSGYPGIIIAFVAVIAGIVGSRRRERFSLAGGTIAGIVLIFLNLQAIGIIPTPVKNPGLMRNYSNAIRSSIEIFKAAKKEASSPTQKKNETAKKKLLLAIDKSLSAAEKLKPERFDPHIPGFSMHFRDEFVLGLKLLKSGYTTGDKLEKVKGAALLDKWGQWNHDHRKEFVNLWHRWRPQPSLFRTIFKKQ